MTKFTCKNKKFIYSIILTKKFFILISLCNVKIIIKFEFQWSCVNAYSFWALTSACWFALFDFEWFISNKAHEVNVKNKISKISRAIYICRRNFPLCVELNVPNESVSRLYNIRAYFINMRRGFNKTNVVRTNFFHNHALELSSFYFG